MRRYAAASLIAAAAAVAATGVAAAAPPPLPMTGAPMPADGATFTTTAGTIPFEISTSAHESSLSIEVSTQNIPGQDGTLADDYVVDLVRLTESDAYPDIFRGNSRSGTYSWPGKPGTYYWQVSGQCLCDPATRYPTAVAGPVYTIVVQAPPAPPAPPVVEPEPDPSTPPPSLTSHQANALVSPGVYRMTHHRPTDLHRSCSRTSDTRFRCRATWVDSVWAWTGTFTFTASSSRVRQAFTGRRAKKSCLRRKHGSRSCFVSYIEG